MLGFLILNSLLPVFLFLPGLLWKKHPPPENEPGLWVPDPQVFKKRGSLEIRPCPLRQGFPLVRKYFAFAFSPFLFLFQEKIEQITLWISVIQIKALLLSLLPTELALRRKFDHGGRPRRNEQIK